MRNSRSLRLISFAAVGVLSFEMAAAGVVSLIRSGKEPAPEKQSAGIEYDGRLSRLTGRLDITHLTTLPENLYSGNFVGDSEGFDWYLSRHYAVKTDLDKDAAAEALTILELGYGQLKAIFGTEPPGSDKYRMPIVFASSRNALLKAATDDCMYSFEHGGVTQEGYSASYLYAGTPYQTRYILLHEAAHLYQYCITGNTRSCHGFLIEGIADFFSSHVYDSNEKTLTVNVLDRAPIHNHIAQAFNDWKNNGTPSVQEIYDNGSPTRHESVLLCAFLQSTPKSELAWRNYCHDIITADILKKDHKTSKERSDENLNRHYFSGNANATIASLDSEFQRWVKELTPSYELPLQKREFDQDGNTFISAYPASVEHEAVLRLPPTASKRGLFVRDWHGDIKYLPDDELLYKLDLKWPDEFAPASFAALRFSFKDEDGKIQPPFISCVISNAPSPGLAFFDVNGVRDQQMSNRRMPARMKDPLSIEISGNGNDTLTVALLHKKEKIAEINTLLPKDKTIVDFKNALPSIATTQPGVSFIPYETGIAETQTEDFTKNNIKLPPGARFASTEPLHHRPLRELKTKETTPITEWYLLGTYASENKEPSPKSKLPCSSDISEVQKRGDGTFVMWKKAELNHTPVVTAPIVNIARNLNAQGNYQTAYALTFIDSGKDQNVNLILGITDQVTVYVNDKQINKADENTIKNREWSDRNTVIPISLKEGRNTLILKLDHSDWVWLLSGEIAEL